jgi:large repetitive protein
VSQRRRPTSLRPRRLSTLVAALVCALACVVPAALDASTASAAPSPGYTASYLPAGTGVTEGVAVNPDTGTVYVGDSAGQLIVIDGSTNSIVTTLTLTGVVGGVAVDSTTDTVYAVTSSEVAVIDGATNSVTTTIAIPAGVTPEYGIAVDSATGQIYVTDQADNSDGSATGGGVFVIDGGTNAVVTSFSSGGGGPEGIAVDESTDVVWVANLSGTVAAIDAATGSIVGSVSVSGEVSSVSIDPATSTVYVAAGTAGGVTGGLAVINESAVTLTTTLPLSGIAGVAVDPSADVVYAVGSETSVIDGTTNTVADTIPNPGGRFVAVDTATGSVYQDVGAGLWAITPSAANAVSPLVGGPTSDTFTVGTAVSLQFAVVGLPAPTLTVTGSLPAGVTLSQTGILSGTPAPGTGGVYPLTITASNGIAPDYSEAFTLTVDEAPTVTVPAAVTLQLGVPASVPIQVTGYPAPSVQLFGSWPTGLELSQSASGGWELSGTPAPGSTGLEYGADFEAVNGAGTATAEMTITVQEAPSFPSAATGTFQSDGINSYTFSADCVPVCTYSATGLPSGLTLDPSGLLSGDPAAGTYTFTITASSSLGTATEDFTLVVQLSAAVGAAYGTELAAEAPPLGNSWVLLGGVITAAPAVAAVPTPGGTTPVAPLFFAPGSNQELWMYSVTAGWAPVGPSVAFCLGSPAAVVTGSTLTVACEGLNRQLYYNTATLPSSGLPSFTGPWVSLGGILSAGPAVAPIGGVLTFFAEGTNGQVFTNTGSGYTPTNWICISTLAAATDASTGITTFGCQGGDHTLWTATNPGTGWSAAHSLGGQLIGGPGIATGGGVTEYFAEGLNQSIYEWTQNNGWILLNEYAVGGAGAVALN